METITQALMLVASAADAYFITETEVALKHAMESMRPSENTIKIGLAQYSWNAMRLFSRWLLLQISQVHGVIN